MVLVSYNHRIITENQSFALLRRFEGYNCALTIVGWRFVEVYDYTDYRGLKICRGVWLCTTVIARFMGEHGAHLGPTGPRWAPCWSHEICYLGNYPGLYRLCIRDAISLSGINDCLNTWYGNDCLFIIKLAGSYCEASVDIQEHSLHWMWFIRIRTYLLWIIEYSRYV